MVGTASGGTFFAASLKNKDQILFDYVLEGTWKTCAVIINKHINYTSCHKEAIPANSNLIFIFATARNLNRQYNTSISSS